MAKARDHRPLAATREGLAHQLGQIDGVLPGSVVVRHMPCGKSGCACKAEPPELRGPTSSGLAPSKARPSPAT